MDPFLQEISLHEEQMNHQQNPYSLYSSFFQWKLWHSFFAGVL